MMKQTTFRSKQFTRARRAKRAITITDKEYYIIREGKATQVRRREFEKEVHFDRLEVIFEDEGALTRRVEIFSNSAGCLSESPRTTFKASVQLSDNYGFAHTENSKKQHDKIIASALQELNFVGRDYISDEELLDLLGQEIELNFKFVH